MRKQFILMMLLFFAGTSISKTYAQSLVVQMKGGIEYVALLNSDPKVTFSGDQLRLQSNSSLSQSLSIADVNKIYFKDVVSSIGSSSLDQVSNRMYIYPNPVSQSIQFKNAIDEVSLATIFSMDGVKLLQVTISPANEMIDVSLLAKGVYLLKINQQVIKFKKL